MPAAKIEVLIQKKLRQKFQDFKKYIKRLLFPLYFFPIKLFSYSLYYGLKLALKSVIWPFRSFGNFFKATAGLALLVYIFFSLVVIADYIRKNYGHYSKFLCGYGVKEQLSQSVVRVVGGLSEGSGFFLAPSQVITNFHVIYDEPSPKIIFSSGGFVTPQKIIGDKDADLALLFLPEQYPDLVLPFTKDEGLFENEPLLAAGYALGTLMPGEITIQEGKFKAFRTTRDDPAFYIQADIDLVPGMSGGPLVEKCGSLVGINTLGLAGLSIFISAASVEEMIPYFTDADITKIEVDPSTPAGAVEAFYTYLKARRMEEGFALLSKEYLQKTNFAEWTGRFADVLDVQIYETRLEEVGRNLVFVKFSTKNWVYEEVEKHFYEGTWETVFEDGVYKMLRSNIKEVFYPDPSWFYTQEELEELEGTPLF